MRGKIEKQSGRRIVLTGMGLVSSVGLTLESLWTACREGTGGVRPFSLVENQDSPIAFAGAAIDFTGDINDFGELEPHLKKDIRKSLKLMSREIQMGVASAQRALRSAQVFSGTFVPERVGVSFASEYIITAPEEILPGVEACSENGQFDFSRWGSEGLPKMTPIWQLKFLPNMSTSHISILNSFHGAGFNITNREASIGSVMTEAVEMIRSGRVDAMLVGATGSRIQPFKLMTAVLNDKLADRNLPPDEASRPFDRDRTGMVLGEGAGALFLESQESALQRGVPILAEIVAGSARAVLERGKGSDRAFFDSDPELITESYRLTLESLFERVDIKPGEIGHINANGLGTPAMDAAEALAIRRFFGDAADKIPVTCIKGHLGNPGAGGGAIELIASVLAMNCDALFPIKNNLNDDPACPIWPVREFGVPAGDTFLKLAGQTFGQTSAVLVCRWNA